MQIKCLWRHLLPHKKHEVKRNTAMLYMSECDKTEYSRTRLQRADSCNIILLVPINQKWLQRVSIQNGYNENG